MKTSEQVKLLSEILDSVFKEGFEYCDNEGLGERLDLSVHLVNIFEIFENQNRNCH